MKPTRERRDHWPAHGPILRRQPPVRVRWCNVANPVRQAKECEAGGPDCRGRRLPCPNCRFVYCEAHIDHFSGLTVPPDSWKGLYVKMARNIEKSAKIKRATLYVKTEDNHAMTDYRIAGQVADARPPARVEYCEVPSSGRVNSPCGHQSKTCTGATHTCDWCRFTYCDRHIVFHVRRLVVPRKLWDAAVELLQAAMDAVQNRERKLVRVDLPRTSFLEPPEA